MTTEYYPVVPFKPIELIELTSLTDVDMDLIRVGTEGVEPCNAEVSQMIRSRIII
jgi:hypothetical protein